MAVSEHFVFGWSTRLAPLSALLAAIVVVWVAVRLAWLLVAGPEVASDQVPPIPRAVQTASPTGEFRWDLFGPARAPAQPVVRELPSSRSDLRLVGVVSGGSRGYAIIADSQGTEGVYRVGDELPGGLNLEQVEPARVVISAAGRSEVLELDREGGTRGSVRSSGRATSPGQVSRAAPAGERPAAVAPLAGLRGFQMADGAGVASMPSLAGVDVARLGQQISVMPVASGGFRVRPGRDATLFRDLGLQANDIVMAVNGRPLDNENAVQALFTDVLTRGEVAITISRHGQEIVLRPDIEQIAGSLR